MITLTGKKISEGIAIGKLSFYKRDTKEIRRIYVKDVEKEVMRFQKASISGYARFFPHMQRSPCHNDFRGLMTSSPPAVYTVCVTISWAQYAIC